MGSCGAYDGRQPKVGFPLVLWLWLYVCSCFDVSSARETRQADYLFYEASDVFDSSDYSDQILTSSGQLQRLDGFVEELMSCRGIHGLTLSVVVGQEVTLKRGYGFADVESRAEVGEGTIFCVASLSKAFTSVLLGKLLPRYK